jgi:protein-disulfide isomerase
MTKRRKFAAVAAVLPLLLLHAALSAVAGEPMRFTVSASDAATPNMSVDTMSDEWAGKNADLAAIAHSPADESPYLGPKEALVVVNIFSDFQCPVCKRSADPIKQLVLDYPDKVKVVFRNNALRIHPRAEAAAVAALAAGKQGKFWQYHDRVFDAQRALDDASLRQIAGDLRLNLEQWVKDVADPKNVQKVRLESQAAVRLGVPGTPGIFVNGVRHEGWGSYRGLHQVTGIELRAAEALAKSGTPLREVAATRIREGAPKNRTRTGQESVDPEYWVKVLLAD